MPLGGKQESQARCQFQNFIPPFLVASRKENL
jgi:hypothetical protein